MDELWTSLPDAAENPVPAEMDTGAMPNEQRVEQ
jgi:hypothetical protein